MIAHAIFDSPWRLKPICWFRVFIFRQLTSNDYCFAISSVADRTFYSSLYARDPRQSCALDSTPWIPSSRYSVLDSGLQPLVGFRIPKPRMPDSTSTSFHDSGIPKKKKFRINVHGAIWCSWKYLNVCVRGKDRVNRSQRSKGSYKACCWVCNDFYIG